MKRRKHTPEQIVRKLREGERLQAEGGDIATVAKHLEISEQTFHRWRNQYGGMQADDASKPKELEKENARLKHIVALKEVAKGRTRSRRVTVTGPTWTRFSGLGEVADEGPGGA